MDLRIYLVKKNISKKAFAKKLGISYRVFWEILGGRDIRMSMAHNIIEKTNGEVAFEDLWANISEVNENI